jgi:hypothetical protein
LVLSLHISSSDSVSDVRHTAIRLHGEERRKTMPAKKKATKKLGKGKKLSKKQTLGRKAVVLVE